LSDHLVAVILSVFEPGIGVRGKIWIVAEDILGALVFFELNEKTLFADIDMERIVFFSPADTFA